LSEADPLLSILVVEGSKNNFNDPTVTNPAVFLTHLASDSKNTIFYKGRKSDKLGGREPLVPAGGILGGGSSINFMMYSSFSRQYQSVLTEMGIQGRKVSILITLKLMAGDNKTSYPC
jgi:hypothetical protein